MAPNTNSLARHQRPLRSSTEDTSSLHRALSDLSFQYHQLIKGPAAPTASTPFLPFISEAAEVDATCECCSMSEACTLDYVRRVRAAFAGKWICGLCSEAVEEATKNGGRRREALEAHVSECARFNGIGRTHPALFQADAVRKILRKARPAVQPQDRKARKSIGGA